MSNRKTFLTRFTFFQAPIDFSPYFRYLELSSLKSLEGGKEMKKKYFFLVILLFLLGSWTISLNAGDSSGNSVTFENRSGEDALVKLVARSGQESSVFVKNGTSATVNNLSQGTHSYSVRYSTEVNCRYSLGNSFTVLYDGINEKSKITITLLGKLNRNNYAYLKKPYPLDPSGFFN